MNLTIASRFLSDKFRWVIFRRCCPRSSSLRFLWPRHLAMRSVVSRTMAAQQAEPRFPSDCRTAALGQTAWTFVPAKQRAKCRAAQTQLMCVFQAWCFPTGTEAPEQCCFVESWGKVTMKAVRSEGTPLLAKQGCFSFYLYFFFIKVDDRKQEGRYFFSLRAVLLSWLFYATTPPRASSTAAGRTGLPAAAGVGPLGPGSLSRRVTPSPTRHRDRRDPWDGCLCGSARSTAGPGQAERDRVRSQEESRPRSPLTSRPGGEWGSAPAATAGGCHGNQTPTAWGRGSIPLRPTNAGRRAEAGIEPRLRARGASRLPSARQDVRRTSEPPEEPVATGGPRRKSFEAS